MKAKLPIIGLVLTGEDSRKALEPQEPVVVAVPTPTPSDPKAAEKIINVLGGILENGGGRLSNEKTISAKLLQANKEWVYRNNDVIATAVSEIEFVLYSIGMKAGQITYTEIETNALLDLLDKFNESNTTSDGVYITQSHKKLTGDAFWYLDKNGSVVRNIFILPPDKIELKLGDPTDSTAELIEAYVYKDVIDGKKITRTYRPDQVIHFKTPNPNNPFRGYGAVEAAADTIDVDNLTNATTKSFFERGAITNFVLSTEQTITDDQLTRLTTELRAAYTGVQNAYKTMILGGGLKPERISFSNKDMEFLAQLEWYRDKIMVIFGNTKASLGIIEDVNRASHESSIISWKTNTIKPAMRALTDTLNEFLVPMFGKNMVLGFKDPVPENREAKLNEVEKGARILTVNERRALLGYDPIEGGDVVPEVRANELGDQMADAISGAPKPGQPEKVIIPAALRNVNMKFILRRQKWFEALQKNQELKEAAIPLAKKLLADRKKRKSSNKSDTPDAPIPTHNESANFDDETVWKYWGKQIHIVDQFEERFEKEVVKFLEFFEKEVLANLESEISQKTGKFKKTVVKKDLYNEVELVTKAQIDLTPLLMEEIVIAGQAAYNLMGIDDPYMPFAIKDAVLANVKKFTLSMLDTDRAKLVDIITNGLKEGESVPQIRKKITEQFSNFKKSQANLITRTEVIKASNMASLDAFEQSGIVIAKQWLTAEDDRVDSVLCAPMNGKIIGLKDKFFRKGEEFNGHVFDYESIKQPPLHPGCRCVLLPVLRDSK